MTVSVVIKCWSEYRMDEMTCDLNEIRGFNISARKISDIINAKGKKQQS